MVASWNGGGLMSGGFFDLIVAQSDAAASRGAQRENSARLALSAHTVTTKGLVAIRYTEPLMFEGAFLEAPHLSTGLAIQADVDPRSGWVPTCTVGVYQWHRNPKGHYTGAYIFIGVRDGLQDAELQHHFIFFGIAYKDLGQAVATEAQLLSPRPVGFGGL